LTQTKLAGGGASPTFDAPTREQRARMMLEGRQGHRRHATKEGDGGQLVPHLAGFVTTVATVGETQLPRLAASEALDAAIVDERARAKEARRKGHGGATFAEIDHRQVVAELTRVVTTRHPVTQAQLSILAIAPALGGAVVEPRAGVSTPGAEGGGRAAAT